MYTSVDPQNLGHTIASSLTHLYPPIAHKPRQHPLLYAFLYGLGVFALSISGALIFGTFANSPDVVDLSEDAAFEVAVFAFFLIMYYYLVFPKLVGATFDKLIHEKVLPESEIKVSAVLLRHFESKTIRLMPVFLVTPIVIILMFDYVFNFDDVTMWSEPNLFFYTCSMVGNIIGWLALASLMVNLILVILLIHSVFVNNRVEVFPLHQDGSGGFGALARFSLRMSYLALIIAAFIIGQVISALRRESLSREYFIVFNSLAYLLIVPALFYLPLHQAHRAMLGYRAELISQTSLQYAARHKALLAEIPSNANALANQLKYLEELERLQAYNRKYPVWPFSMSVRIAVIANAITPLVPTVIGLVVENFA